MANNASVDHVHRQLIGLDLFSGIGGISEALSEWVRPIAYCENDRFAQGVLLSRMAKGQLPRAPIWDDITTLRGSMLPAVDIVYGGFPCQDISVAGRRVGLDGERSGLIREVWRLADELRPRFIFLENVPAIVSGGLDRILGALAERGYDARWLCLSAAELGACHIRNRWWLLAYAASSRRPRELPAQTALRPIVSARHRGDGEDGNAAHSNPRGSWKLFPRAYVQTEMQAEHQRNGAVGNATDTNGSRLEGRERRELCECASEWTARPSNPSFAITASKGSSHRAALAAGARQRTEQPQRCFGWPTVAPVCGADARLPNRSNRIAALGNSVNVIQAREAFRRLIGGE